jgi:hypothetical protein
MRRFATGNAGKLRMHATAGMAPEWTEMRPMISALSGWLQAAPAALRRRGCYLFRLEGIVFAALTQFKVQFKVRCKAHFNAVR